ncbi:MAG: thiamine diphosphokinase [Bacillales bacterium]|nr:thiamine diphosphokinase [Bacillales bacterium]
MGRCIIVGASLDSQRLFSYDENDYIIGSDGGCLFLSENGYRIDLAIGDFDSLNMLPKENKYIRLNPIKDITDTHAAIEEGIKLGYKEFLIYGCIGGRIDHSIALMQDVLFYVEKGIKITVFSKNQTIEFLRNGEKNLFQEEGYISIFAYKEAKGVTLKNLKYELIDYDLNDKFPLGVSNEFINKKATIEVKDGCLIIVY